MSTNRRRAAGFTLVELLVVILIIGILVSLLIPSVYYVIRRARIFSDGTTIGQLEQAINAYKDKYGDYPPDFADVMARSNLGTIAYDPARFAQTVTYRHIRKAYPRITTVELNYVGEYIWENALTPSEAIVFWLGGMSANPQQPFTGTGGPLVNIGNPQNPQFALRIQERNAPIFTFEEPRLLPRPASGPPYVGASFLPKGSTTPYVYFDSRTYNFVYVDGNGNTLPGYSGYSAVVPDDPASVTIALPYKSDIVNSTFPSSASDSLLLDNIVYFANRDTFQIISPGQDGLYGPIVTAATRLVYDDANGNQVPLFTRFPSGLGFHPEEWQYGQQANLNATPSLLPYMQGQEDNLTNFSEGRTIQDSAEE